MRALDGVLGLGIVLTIVMATATNSQAGGKGEVIENIILFGLGRGVVTTGREMMQEDGNRTPNSVPQLSPPGSTAPFPDPCLANNKISSGCGNTDDLLNALKATKDKIGEERKTDPLADICDRSIETYDGLKCLQEKHLSDQLNAVGTESEN